MPRARPLRIGVDARPLTRPTTGIGRYTGEIVRRLAASQHEVYLYAHQPLATLVPGANLRTGRLRQGKLSSLHAQLRYPGWLRKDRIDVFFSPRHHLPLATAVPTVVTVHDLVWRKAPQSMTALGRALDRLLMPPSLGKADAIIAVSRATREDLLEHQPALKSKISVIPEAAFTPAKVPPPRRGAYALCVSTFEPRKNLRTVLRAYAELLAQGVTSHRLVLAGNPGWKQDIGGEIAELGLASHVTLAQSASQQALEKLYADCDFLVHAALYEGFGLPILEAMTFGKPVITSNISSMPEVAGDAALLVDPTSVKGICSAMRQLIEDGSLYESLAARARPQAARFSWDEAAAATLKVIEGAVEQPSC